MELSIGRLKRMRASEAEAVSDEVGDKEILAALDELIAIREMKGDQVPVALIDERQGSGGFCLTQHGRRLSLKHGTELFTAPQNPVVLPKIRDSKYCGGVEFRCDKYQLDVQAAIESAGGIVKDGE